MKTKTIELYEYDELPADVQAKVIEKNRDINTDYEWHDMTLDEWKSKLEAMGFDSPDISFSGFCSQGDGASFTCKRVDVLKFTTSQKAKGKFKDLLKGMKRERIEVNASVDRIDRHYYHENTVRGSVEVSQDSISDETFNNAFHNAAMVEGDSLENLITETVRKLSRQIYRELENEYTELCSDESIIDTIKANEYTFTASGKMENI